MSLEAVSLIVIAYLVGSIPMSYLLGRWVKGIDLRRYGGGSLGASNVGVHVGKWATFSSGGFDLLVKGVVIILVARGLDLGSVSQGLVGLAAVAGHNWSLYVGFSGGRGLSTGGGILAVLAPQQLVLVAILGLLGRIVFRNSALWFFIGFALLPLTSLLLGEPAGVVVFAGGFLALTALKRVTANVQEGAPGTRLKQILVYRLLYDRAVPTRDAWVYRTPEDREGEA